MKLIWEGLRSAVDLLIARDPLVIDAAARSFQLSTTAVAAGSVVGVTLGLLLARRRFFGRGACVLLFRAAMGLPTVLIGLICYAMFSRRGPLGALELLYTPWGIVLGEFFLATPIIVTLTYGAVRSLDTRVAETAKTLGAGMVRRGLTYLSEARLGVTLAVLTAFTRCFTELGVAMMVGGNLKFRTRTLATATALETAKGEFGRGVAMSLILLLMALAITLAIAWIGREEGDGQR